MRTGDMVLLAVAVVLVLFAATLAGIETALSRTSRFRAQQHERDARRGAANLRRVAEDTPRYVNLLLLLRVIAELGATAIAAVLIVRQIGSGNAAIAATVLVMTLVVYIGVGVAPRTLGAQHAEAIALRTAGFVIALNRVFGPLPRLLILVGNALTPGRGFPSGPFATESELRDLVDLAEQRDVIEHDEREMIHGVFELGDTLAREVMVPRPDIVFIERGKTVRQALTLALRSGFSRIPVVGESADDIVGVTYVKDLVRRSQEGRDDLKVEDVMRSPTFAPESKPVDELLRQMQADQTHMAIVIDEYGGTAGLVTIEDILEEIVGEIADEYDREAPLVEEVDAQTVRVSARLPIDEINEMYDLDLASDDVDTVSGLLARELGRVPIPGATVTVDGLTFTAESAKGRRNRIGTVLIRRNAADK